ncbi:MAG: hypothetical protein LRY55_04950 [Leadbetterella sp.]|nr:hypothetical protein [Leadbetterella sp.]
MKKIILFLFLLQIQLQAQETRYNSSDVFSPLTNYLPGNKYRSASGQPGPEYWQNRADYRIKATLDTAKNGVSGGSNHHLTRTTRPTSSPLSGFSWTRTNSGRTRAATALRR